VLNAEAECSMRTLVFYFAIFANRALPLRAAEKISEKSLDSAKPADRIASSLQSGANGATTPILKTMSLYRR